MSTFERDPKKRRVKPVQQSLLDFDLGESSDDSDFRIEDHQETDDDSLESDEGAGNNDDNEESDSDDDDDEDDDDEGIAKATLQSTLSKDLTVGQLIEQARNCTAGIKQEVCDSLPSIRICSGCLGDRSDDTNEIAECDGCGVMVHEGCYGVSDSASISSTVSSCSTEPWFCEACRAGVSDPVCELCPNTGGIFKETDVGKWVHLVCALYVPGVAFGEVDRLSNVTLFEMPYSRWGAKTCSLCEDERFARTGVCISCDAGMCRTFFHVTCAQREGLLAEAHSEEVDQADPFYAHCKQHTDKTHMKRRRRNWLALQLQVRLRKQTGHTGDVQRIQRKLAKSRQNYLLHKQSRNPPWVPTQKMPRLLTTSASACRELLRKAELMGIDTQALEVQDLHIASLVDVHKKWHIPPAFSVEFIGYYLDRNSRLLAMKRHLKELLEQSSHLQSEQAELREKYDQVLKEHEDVIKQKELLESLMNIYHSTIKALAPGKHLPTVETIPVMSPKTQRVALLHLSRQGSKKGTFHRLKSPPVQSDESGTDVSIGMSKSDTLSMNECGICRATKDQHLLAKCDTCHRHYHLGCLNPPLTRMPKKTKLMGWQCSECDRESSGSDIFCADTEAPRKLRHVKGDALQQPLLESSILNYIEPKTELEEKPVLIAITPVSSQISSEESPDLNQLKRKRRREERRKKKRFSDDFVMQPPIKIKIKPILPPPACSTSNAPVVIAEPVQIPERRVIRVSSGSSKKPKEPDTRTKCDVCQGAGNNDNLVRCDECRRCYHFSCLDPPVRKSPKRRGYSWHCADCDPTDFSNSDKD